MYNYDIDKFDEFGYVILTDFLLSGEYEQLHEECYRLTDLGKLRSDNGDGWIMNSQHNPCKLDGAMNRSPVFRRLGRNKNLVEVAQKLLGVSTVDTYISKFFPMLPKIGFSVDWHQDNFYIKSDPKQMISCDVFVHGASKDNGCLRIIPKSHRENILNHTHPSNGSFFWLKTDNDNPNIVDIELDVPFAIFFHVNLVHGCYKNKSDKYRYSVAWEYVNSKYVPPSHNGHQSQDRNNT